MKNPSILIGLIAVFISMSVDVASQQRDWRNIKTGDMIPDLSYSDQPYVIKTDDGAWLVVLTTAVGHEGSSGQHIITQRSFDQGKTWQDQVAVEPPDGPEASYAVLLKAPNGRVFVFYNHNTDNTRWVIGDSPPYRDGRVERVDSQGHFVFKYSDDHGKTWSAQRYDIPMRLFEIDKNNPYGGSIKFFWNVGKAFSHEGIAYVPVHKVGGFGDGFFTSSEGALLSSSNLLTELDPKNARWQTWPEGEIGLRTPVGGGPIAEEQSFVVLSDGSFYCVYRTIDGYPVFTYSRDRGKTWDAPQYMRYANGRLMKHPRAANFVWRCENGKYLYWFHNHGGRFIEEHPRRRSVAYNDRNPVWLSGGVEKDSPHGKIIEWSQPEILLYDDDPIIRMSYPDLVEEDGQYYITETQKDIARTHLIDKKLLHQLWNQEHVQEQSQDGLLHRWLRERQGEKAEVGVSWGGFPDLYVRNTQNIDHAGESTEQGFTIDIAFKVPEKGKSITLLDAFDEQDKGWKVVYTDNSSIELTFSDGQTRAFWKSDSTDLATGDTCYTSIIVDGGPKLISFIVDGLLHDGGDQRQFGWGRFSPYIKSANGRNSISIDSSVSAVTLYKRALLTTEGIGNYQAYHNVINH